MNYLNPNMSNEKKTFTFFFAVTGLYLLIVGGLMYYEMTKPPETTTVRLVCKSITNIPNPTTKPLIKFSDLPTLEN